MPQQRTAAERLAELQGKKKKADARLTALENKLKDREHRDDVRRKMILGDLVLANVATHPQLAKWVRDALRTDLKKPEQLVLFADILKGDAA